MFCDRIYSVDQLSNDRTPEILRRLARELDHLTVQRSSDAGDSHRVLEPYAGTATWALGIDGDELYDPGALARLRDELEAGVRGRVPLKGHVLNCEELEERQGPGVRLPGSAVAPRDQACRRLELSHLTRGAVEGRLQIHRWTLLRWLLAGARAEVSGVWSLTSRDRRKTGRTGVPEFEPRDRAHGFLLGVSRDDFGRVNGYDTRFVGWGEEDVDLAVRLRRLELRCGHAGPSATVLHLWHPTPVRRDHPNSPLLDETECSYRIEAVQGLRELAAEPMFEKPDA